MTKATSETTKLNFITDQGSTRATVRCACRAERFDFPFRAEFRIMTGPSLAAVLPASALPGWRARQPPGAAEPVADVPDRRNVRAGDDGGWRRVGHLPRERGRGHGRRLAGAGATADDRTP